LPALTTSDPNLAKAQAPQRVTKENFRTDVNATGDSGTWIERWYGVTKPPRLSQCPGMSPEISA